MWQHERKRKKERDGAGSEGGLHDSDAVAKLIAKEGRISRGSAVKIN